MQIEQNKSILYRFSLILLVAVFAFQLGRHVNDFYVPESDFFDFRDKALSLRQGEWPDNFKRPPLYSASIAAVSLLIPGQERELYAAEAIGVLAAIASLLLVYRIGTHFFGRNAIFLAWLWAFHPSTLRMAIKPKSEMLVTLLILWAFYLFIKEKRWAYFVGFLASCVRYEGALIIAAVGAADFFTRKEKLQAIGYSIISGAFIVIWTLAQSGGSEGSSYFSYFDSYKPNFAFVLSFWQGMIGFLPDAMHKFNVLWFAMLMLLGYVYVWRKHRRIFWAQSLFFIGFLAMHIAWPMPNFDYQVVIAWNALLAAAFGVAWVAERKAVIGTAKKLLNNRWLVYIAAAALLTVSIVLFRSEQAYPQYRVSLLMWMALLLPLVLALFAAFAGKREPGIASVLLFLVFASAILYSMLSDTNALMYSIRYSKAEFRAVGEWFQQHSYPGDKLVVEQPVIVSYYAQLPQERFVRLVDLPNVDADSLHAWCRNNGISHIAWLSANKIFDTDNAWYRWKMKNRGWSTINFLQKGVDSNGFRLVKKIRVGPRLAYIYTI